MSVKRGSPSLPKTRYESRAISCMHKHHEELFYDVFKLRDASFRGFD